MPPKIDYKDVKLLQRYVSERGKIVPSRISAVSARKQRELALAIKRARFLASAALFGKIGGTDATHSLGESGKSRPDGRCRAGSSQATRGIIFFRKAKRFVSAKKTKKSLNPESWNWKLAIWSGAKMPKASLKSWKAANSSSSGRLRDTGSLYGSVSKRDISDAAAEEGVTLNRQQIELARPIKFLGIHAVQLSLHPEVEVELKINVARSRDEAALQSEGKTIASLAEEMAEEDRREHAEMFDSMGAVLQEDEEDGHAEEEDSQLESELPAA